MVLGLRGCCKTGAGVPCSRAAARGEPVAARGLPTRVVCRPSARQVLQRALSEADCRVAEFRVRELRADAAWRHRAEQGSVTRRSRGAAAGELSGHVGALLVRARRHLHGVRPGEAVGPAVAVRAELGAGK